jgi:ABC-type lipoprotein export system ATPase subunit
MLRASGLTKSYRAPDGSRLVVLSDVDVAVGAGEFAVITGPSGSGKSTLLNLLGLLEDPDAGDVWFGDTRVTGLGRSGKSRARGGTIGFVFQSFLLLPSLSAVDNVLLAARYVGGHDRAATRRRAMDLLAEVGLSARARHFPPQLSGGEQQRVAFCRAVLNDPPLVLADEPTGNLDDDNGRVILDQLRRRARAGRSVVVVTHRPDVADDATTVLRLDAGRLAGVRDHLASGRAYTPPR